ncbi:Bug family tripartite tricarboxylate transporter substrate binding protein [Alicycliphilus denitrificans]|uniref:Bug family tripartite tricarboxylate transporter substrate binding protein n=1 Tax=Alicycliphilus denitrificans TaxID=179636 RepID=UPI003A80802A
MNATHDSIGRRRLLRGAAAAGIGLAGLPAGAATFPSRPVTIVVPYAPGGAVDIAARHLQTALQEAWGQPVVVENVSGASGIVGAQRVQRAAPDGQTLLLTISNTHAILPHMQALPFDPFKDFAGIATVVRAQSGLFVRTDHPAQTLPDFFRHARASKQPIAVGDWGVGSLGHMMAAGLAIDHSFAVTSVHYRGAAPIIQAMLGGEISVGTADVSSVLPQAAAGKLRMLAVNGTARHPAMKNTPTFSEFGIHEYDSYSWIGLFTPAGTPLALREQIARTFQKITLAPEMQARLLERGYVAATSDPAQFDAEWRETYERFGNLVKKTGIKTDN